MGAGRTELAMSVFGRSYGSNISGEIYIKGKRTDLSDVQSAIDAGLAYATEDRKVYGLNLLQNIRENASLASLRKLSRHGIMDDNIERKEVSQYRRDFNELIGICDRIYTVSQGVVTDNVGKQGFTQEYLMRGMTKEREVAAR